jgi:hypothetical protein
MRNYWFRIFLGALAIFAIGMIGVSLVRRGHARIHRVLDSDETLTIPLAFVPFVLSGERLGTLEHVTVLRDSPRSVSSVELAVDLEDSLLSRGLAGCRLATNFESDRQGGGIDIRTADRDKSVFWCLAGDSVPSELVEFGEAVFEPGEVRVPLYLQQELVSELRKGFADDSTAAITEARADSLSELAELKADSAVAAATRAADSLGRAGRRLGDSLRAAARSQLDSIAIE